MSELSGKTVLVTGAAQGIGRSMALALGAAGANLVLVDLDRDALAEVEGLLSSSGSRAISKWMDVTDADQCERLREAAASAFGSVDVVVNNAAVGPQSIAPDYISNPRKFWDVQDDVWLMMLRVNVFGPQLLARTFVKDMLARRWGRIVNITTSLDTMYRQGVGGYGPCKAALEAATRIMALDLEGTGVNANVLVPGGPVNTRMVPVESGLAQGDLIQPEQMNQPLMWLCSERSNGFNGIRVVAQKWKPDQTLEACIANATAPVAWPQLGSQSVFPGASLR